MSFIIYDMSELITSVKEEPNFPFEDITKDNSNILAVMLSSPEVLAGFHAMAEDAVRLYKLGHASITNALKEILETPQLRAASFGVTTYEALAAMINNRPPILQSSRVLELAIGPGLGNQVSIDEMGKSVRIFRKQMYNTSEVVLEASRSILPGLPEYVLAGAATARQVELASY